MSRRSGRGCGSLATSKGKLSSLRVATARLDSNDFRSSHGRLVGRKMDVIVTVTDVATAAVKRLSSASVTFVRGPNHGTQPTARGAADPEGMSCPTQFKPRQEV